MFGVWGFDDLGEVVGGCGDTGGGEAVGEPGGGGQVYPSAFGGVADGAGG